MLNINQIIASFVDDAVPRTHNDECYLWHADCAMHKVADAYKAEVVLSNRLADVLHALKCDVKCTHATCKDADAALKFYETVRNG